ncbi:MAG TPA: hypothetical protein VFQ91_00645 [Bryobacteraceae bacterium]|nr:hypothetical protein [Bryobacteraceae bacterium]
MPRIRLVHWNSGEAGEPAALLAAFGYDVDARRLVSSSMKEFRENPPDAVIIDLSRLPSAGQEVAALLRKGKTTRLIPLIFVEGAPDKVARAKQVIPDARFTTYAKIGPVLADVLANPPREAVVPQSWFGPDSPTPLVKKLGIKVGQIIGLVNAPKGFEAQIPGATCKRNPKSAVPLTLWFLESRAGLESALPKIVQCAIDGGVWIIWRKTTKEYKPDLNGNLVRELCLAAGLVDFKICAVDAIWTGMRFAVKARA